MQTRGIVLLLAGLVAGAGVGGVTAVSAVSANRDDTVKVCVGKRNTVVAATKAGKCPTGTTRVAINKQGPAGPTGATGAAGAAGATGATGPGGAAGAPGASASAPGSRTVSALDFGAAPVVIGVAGDSTGNDNFEWVEKTATYLANRYPERRVEYRVWSDTPQSYPAPTIIQQGTGGPVLKIYNGSMPGSALDYHSPRIAAMFPEQLDMLIVNVGHNYRAASPAEYLTAIHTYVNDVKASNPGVEVIVSSQNPSFSDAAWPEANVTAHAARLAALRADAPAQGYGYIPVYEAFRGRPNGGRGLVMADGIHPSYDPAGVDGGADLWATQVRELLDRLSYR